MFCRELFLIVIFGFPDAFCGLEEEISTRIFEKYDKTALPPSLDNTPISLKFGLSIINFDLDEQNHALDVHAWIRMEWTDIRLSYEDIHLRTKGFDYITVEPSSVWTPDIALYNGIEASSIEINTAVKTRILIYPSGKVFWVPPARLRASCYLDMTYWPDDSHTCTLNFGSWTYDAYELELRIRNDENVDLSELKDLYANVDERIKGTKSWELVSSKFYEGSRYYICCDNPYPWIKAELTLKRRAQFYVATIQGPIVALCFLTMVLFLLPPVSRSKIVLAGIILGLDVCFITTIGENMGKISKDAPLIVILLSKQMKAAVASLILCSLISCLSRNPKGREISKSLRNFLEKFSSVLGVSEYNNLDEKISTIQYENFGSEDRLTFINPHIHSSWLLLAAILDRLCLIGFSVYFIVMMACFSEVL